MSVRNAQKNFLIRWIPLLAVGFAFAFPGTAFSVASCPGSLDVQDSQCDMLYPVQQNPGQNASCKQKCQQAKQDCEQAKSTCDSGKAKEAQEIGKGQQNSNQAGNSATGRQGQDGTQGPNANNMCGGQQANQNRANALKPIPQAMQKCAASANKCDDQSGKQAAQQAQKSGQEIGQEISQRLADAAQMGGKCGQSANNEDKMGQMPQMQMPQMPQGSGKGDSGISDSGLGDGNDQNLNNGQTQQVETVKFDGVPSNSVAMAPSASPESAISGSTPSGGNSGFSNITTDTGSGFPASKAAEAATASAKTGGSGASSMGSASGGGAGKPGGGIASAEIKPDTSAYEVHPGAGKAMLGLKGKGGGDDEEFPGLPARPAKEATPAVAKALRQPASDSFKSGAAVADETTSLFKMVKSRYRNLRELGQI